MSEFCGPEFMVVLGTREDIRLIPFAEILPHSFTKDNLEPAEPLKSGTVLTPHGTDPDMYSDGVELDDEYEDPDEDFEEDLDEELNDSSVNNSDSGVEVFIFDDEEDLSALSDRWED
jgi:hypothetical protein